MSSDSSSSSRSSCSAYTDVLVIGAGWSGVLATKYMLEEGLTVTTLEKRDGLGGVWYYSDDPNLKTTMKSTRTTSSATISEMSDYPMTEEMGEFPYHSQVLDYLQSYALHYNLTDHIHFNTEVDKVTKEGDLWFVSTTTNKVYTSKFLVVCSGLSLPNDTPRQTIFANYTGAIYHSIAIKEPLPEHKGCRLLVFGGGETAADICTDWYSHSSTIHWSAPRGQHFFRRYAKVLPWKNPQSLDKASSWLLTRVAPFHYSKPGLSWICKWSTNGSLLAYQGHGIPEWRNNIPFMHNFINKNGHVLDLIDYVKIVPKGQVTSCNGKTVTFSDGSSQDFDVIILCSGYKESFPFLPKDKRPKSFKSLYKFVVDNEDPSLSFVGYIRPVIGSIFGIIEIQSCLVARLNSRRIPLKSKTERIQETSVDIEYWNNYFKEYSSVNKGSGRDKFVEALIYMNDLGRICHVYPDRYKLFRRNMYHWYVSIVSPFNMTLFRLNDPKRVQRSIETLEKHRKGTLPPLHLVLIGFLRLVWFDWWLERLECIKYMIQTSRWWPMIRGIRLVRFLNWVWCLPKRVLFDNQTTLPT